MAGKWEEVHLGEIVSICTGKLDANASDENGAYPFFTCSTEPLRINSYAFDCDAILVAGNGDLNVKHYHGKFNAYQRTYVISPTQENRIFQRYLYYYLVGYLDILRQQSIGGVIKYIKIGNLTDAKIPLPPLEEQKRIAAILDTADAIRMKRKAAIAKLDELAQSIFLDMFGDPVKNEKGWETSSLPKICTLYSGGTPSTKDKLLWNGNISWFSAKDIKKTFLDNSIDHISIECTRNGKLKLLPQNTIVIVVRGMILAHSFPVACLTTKATINQDLKALLPKCEIVPTFLLHNLIVQTRHVLSHVSLAAHGTTKLDTDALNKIVILQPPLALQNNFNTKVQRLSEIRAKHQFALDTEDTLFSSLQQRAFSGEL